MANVHFFTDKRNKMVKLFPQQEQSTNESASLVYLWTHYENSF